MRKVDTPQRCTQLNEKFATIRICVGAFTLNKAAKSSVAGGHLLPIRAPFQGNEKFESINLRSNLQRKLSYKGQS